MRSSQPGWLPAGHGWLAVGEAPAPAGDGDDDDDDDGLGDVVDGDGLAVDDLADLGERLAWGVRDGVGDGV